MIEINDVRSIIAETEPVYVVAVSRFLGIGSVETYYIFCLRLIVFFLLCALDGATDFVQ
jgi:hypothetical protein